MNSENEQWIYYEGRSWTLPLALTIEAWQLYFDALYFHFISKTESAVPAWEISLLHEQTLVQCWRWKMWKEDSTYTHFGALLLWTGYLPRFVFQLFLWNSKDIVSSKSTVQQRVANYSSDGVLGRHHAHDTMKYWCFRLL